MSDSEEEYGPIDTSWGSQKAAVKEPGWDSLVDPNIKAGPNNLGAGNLHRRGKNFKPISEDLILAQRLNKPVGKKKMQEAIRETEVNLGLPKGERNRKKSLDNAPRKFSQRSTPTSKFKSNVQVPSTTRIPIASTESGSGSNWLQSSLVDVPFWGKAAESTNNLSTLQLSTIQTTRPNYPTPKSDLNRVFTPEIQVKAKVESVWIKRTSQLHANDKSQDVKPFVNTGWGTKINSGQETTAKDNFESTKKTKSDWGDTSWGQEPTDNTASWESFAKQSCTNNNHNAIPSSRPSWLTSIPTQDSLQPSPPRQQANRFSNPSKQRYSDNAPADLPRPSNYRFDQSTPILTTAPPPPPENNILITINVELSKGLKISVDIRELDEPLQLAKDFGQENNIRTANILEALAKLFADQKETALKKKQFKLQRRVFSTQSKPKYYPQGNIYTKSSQQQQQYVPPQTSPAPFSRKVYY